MMNWILTPPKFKRIPKGVFAHRSSKRGCLAVAIVGCVMSLIVLLWWELFWASCLHHNHRTHSRETSPNLPRTRASTEQLSSTLTFVSLSSLIQRPTSVQQPWTWLSSFSDTVPGLAHFCEHMLFYASKKYPVEDEYSDFLSRNGGYDNAYTSTENTNYYFRVNADALSEALDRFAQFFIAPIFTQNGVNREMNAVNAEHLKNLQSDNWRVWQLLKYLSNSQHPFHNFNTGDLQTLNRSDILSKLTTFYRAHYSSNQVSILSNGLSPSTILLWNCPRPGSKS